jgi:hypothetical protein
MNNIEGTGIIKQANEKTVKEIVESSSTVISFKDPVGTDVNINSRRYTNQLT